MREIKFRLWDKTEGKMYHDGFGVMADGTLVFQKPNPIKNPMNVVVEQYTGLKDRDGVEIYEGDVVAVTIVREDPMGSGNDHILVVTSIIEFRGGAFWFCGLSHKFTDCNWDFYNEGHRRVIGTTHDRKDA